MSSILEALKKLDRDRRAQKNGVISIEREILQSPPANKNSKRRFFTLLLVLIGVIVVLLVWYRLRPVAKEKGFISKEKIRHKITSPEASEIRRFPIPEPLGPKPDSQAKPSVSAQTANFLRPTRPETPPAKTPSPFKPVPQSTTPDAASSFKTAPEAAPAAPPKRQYIPSQPLPLLTVAGIAYGDSRKVRLAIVNGQAVTIGESIKGVTIEKITEDTVQFSWQGKTFTLGIGESSRK